MIEITKKILPLAGAAILSSCQKEEFKSNVSLVPKEHNVTKKWVLTFASLNNKDITNKYKVYELKLEKNGLSFLEAEQYFSNKTYKLNTSGTWSFENHNKEIFFDFNNNLFDESFIVQKLTEQEMTLYNEENNHKLKFNC